MYIHGVRRLLSHGFEMFRTCRIISGLFNLEFAVVVLMQGYGWKRCVGVTLSGTVTLVFSGST